METQFNYVFPAIRGIQAHREYYVSMCTLKLIPKMFVFDEEDEMTAEMRAQRILNKARIPEMTRYITSNRNSYVFSAITASIDGKVKFVPFSSEKEQNKVGLLHVPMDSRFIINDGQHRRAAIEHAIHEQPELAEETIAVVFFIDEGLERCQQMFADLNRHAIRPSKSLGVLYDQREDLAIIARKLSLQAPTFKDMVELERSTLSIRSRKLFTLSSVYFATRELLDGLELIGTAVYDTAATFWQQVSNNIPEWQLVHEKKILASEVRQQFIHTHGVVLQAIGRIGNTLLRQKCKNIGEKLTGLKKIDWSRSNATVWEGRAMHGGRISKTTNSVILTCNVIKRKLKLELSENEQRVEDAYKRGEHAQ